MSIMSKIKQSSNKSFQNDSTNIINNKLIALHSKQYYNGSSQCRLQSDLTSLSDPHLYLVLKMCKQNAKGAHSHPSHIYQFITSQDNIYQKMQENLSTFPPLPSIVPAPLKQSIYNLSTRLSTLPPNQDSSPVYPISFKKRLQIFGEYNLPHTRQSIDQYTLFDNVRKNTISSCDYNDDLPLINQPTLEQKLKAENYSLELDRLKTNRRHKIFTPQSAQLRKTMDAFKQIYPQQTPQTQRLTKSIDTRLFHTPPLPQFTHSHVHSYPHNTVPMGNSFIRGEPTHNESFPFHTQNSPNYQQAVIRSQVINFNAHSPTKITFTYENPLQPVQPAYPAQPATNLYQMPPIYKSYQQRPKLGKSYTHNLPLSSSIQNFHACLTREDACNPSASKIKKSTVINKVSSNKCISWGNRIRTQLMGQKQSSPLYKRHNTKTTLINCKQSMILQKLNPKKVKLNQSFSNLSEEQNTKRYYDQDFDFIPKNRRISYNNIDPLSHNINQNYQSFDYHQDYEYPNELLADLHAPCQQHSIEPIKKPKSITEKPKQPFILEQLVHEMKQQQSLKQKVKSDKILPTLLITLATMLLLIQLVI